MLIETGERETLNDLHINFIEGIDHILEKRHDRKSQYRNTNSVELFVTAAGLITSILNLSKFAQSLFYGNTHRIKICLSNITDNKIFITGASKGTPVRSNFLIKSGEKSLIDLSELRLNKPGFISGYIDVDKNGNETPLGFKLEFSYDRDLLMLTNLTLDSKTYPNGFTKLKSYHKFNCWCISDPSKKIMIFSNVLYSTPNAKKDLIFNVIIS